MYHIEYSQIIIKLIYYETLYFVIDLTFGNYLKSRRI